MGVCLVEGEVYVMSLRFESDVCEVVCGCEGVVVLYVYYLFVFVLRYELGLFECGDEVWVGVCVCDCGLDLIYWCVYELLVGVVVYCEVFFLMGDVVGDEFVGVDLVLFFVCECVVLLCFD